MTTLFALLLSVFTFVEYNVENIFDTRHDEGKQDQEFLPDATRHWTEKRYWKKLDRIGKSILSTSEDGILMVTVSSPPVVTRGMMSLAGTTIVRGPGQQLSIRISMSWVLRSVSLLISSLCDMWTIIGLSEGLPLAA